MIAVSNTTPLWYLIAIGQNDLLGNLFEKVFIPTGVHEELASDPRTPEAVRRHILSLPTWLEIRGMRETQTTQAIEGERLLYRRSVGATTAAAP